MPGKHKNGTISFRPSQWERAMIDERVRLSGMHKKDFYARSCIYGKICMVGSKENIQNIVDNVHELAYTMKEIVSQLQAGDFLLSEESYEEFRMDALALAVTLVDILDGAAYLFNKEPETVNDHWKEELEQMEEALKEERRFIGVKGEG